MKIEEVLKKVEGIQTLETIKDLLQVSKEKAIYYIHALRKKGYVKTKRLSNNKRVYNIAFENRLKGTSYQEIINQHSPVKIATSQLHLIYGKKLTYEETLIYALKTKSLRTILASLALFKKIKNWPLLYRLAKQNHVERQIGALYDLARTIMLTRKMTQRFRNHALPKKGERWKDIISGLKSDNFKEIEKTWKIYLPFNKKDLEVYR